MAGQLQPALLTHCRSQAEEAMKRGWEYYDTVRAPQLGGAGQSPGLAGKLV